MKKILLVLVSLLMCFGGESQIIKKSKNLGDDVYSTGEKGFKGFKSASGKTTPEEFEYLVKQKMLWRFNQINDGKKNPKFTKNDLNDILENAVFDENGEFTISEVVKADGMLKETIYSKALQFVAEAFGSANSVIQLKDEDNGIIVCKGKVTEYPDDILGYTFKIQCKDGRFKIDIFNMIEEASSRQSDFNLKDEPIDYYLRPSHYTQSISEAMGLVKFDLDNPIYINNRLTHLLNHIYEMYGLRDEVKAFVVGKKKKADDNW